MLQGYGSTAKNEPSRLISSLTGLGNTMRGKKTKNVITWKSEADLIPVLKEIKRAAKDLHYALESLGMELQVQGYSDRQIHERIKAEFFTAAREVLKEETE